MTNSKFKISIITILVLFPFLAIGQTKFSQLPTATPDTNTSVVGLKNASGIHTDYLFTLQSLKTYIDSGESSGVQSVTAGDGSVTMGGTSVNPTVAINPAYGNVFTVGQTVNLGSSYSTLYGGGGMNITNNSNGYECAFLSDGIEYFGNPSSNYTLFTLDAPSGGNSIDIPAASGTMALTSDITSAINSLSLTAGSGTTVTGSAGVWTVSATGGGSGVSSITAGNGSITVGGTSVNPTVAINDAYSNTFTEPQTVNAGDLTTIVGAGITIGEGGNSLVLLSNDIDFYDGTGETQLIFNTASGTNVIYIPATAGTMALRSDINTAISGLSLTAGSGTSVAGSAGVWTVSATGGTPIGGDGAIQRDSLGYAGGNSNLIYDGANLNLYNGNTFLSTSSNNVFGGGSANDLGADGIYCDGAGDSYIGDYNANENNNNIQVDDNNNQIFIGAGALGNSVQIGQCNATGDDGFFCDGAGHSCIGDYNGNINNNYIRVDDNLQTILLNANNGVNIVTTASAVSGSTSGTVTFSEPFIGGSKQIIIQCAALVGTVSIPFPTPFAYKPIVVNNDANIMALSTTGCKVTGSSLSETIIIEGN